MIPDEIPRRSDHVSNWGQVERADHPLKQFRGDEIKHRGYAKIGQVSRHLKVAPSKIRYTEAYFHLTGKRNHKGERLFTKDEIAQLKRILAVTERFKLAFAELIVRNGLLDMAVGLINQVAEKNLRVVFSDEGPRFTVEGSDLKNITPQS